MLVFRMFSSTPITVEGDRLNVQLRRNFAYGLRVAKSPSSLMSFCSPFYFPANDCWFACVSFHIPVLSFPPALPSISRTSHVCPALSLPKSCWVCLLQVPPPAYFLPFLFILLFRTSLYCGFYLFRVCILFFFPFFTGIFLKNVFEIWFGFFIDLALVYLMLCFLLWIWCMSCVCFHFCHNLS